MIILPKRSAFYHLALLGLVLSLSGCGWGGKPWETKNITGLMPDLKFRLTDASFDKPVTAKDFRGDILLVYFGYTQCPDVCSTTMLKLTNIISTLGEEAHRVKILFVSIDPARDSLRVLKSYTHAFGNYVVGLRGGQGELRSLTKRYRVTYGYGKPNESGNYEVSHSSAVYVFDRRGAARLLLRSNDKTSAIHHDLSRLLSETETS